MAFQKLNVGEPGWGGRLLPDVLCDRQGTGPGCGCPHTDSLVLQIVLERLRQRQGADVLQALATQSQADASPGTGPSVAGSFRHRKRKEG